MASIAIFDKMIDHIHRYFPGLNDEQLSKFECISQLYPQWNEKINVISRKDIDNLEVNHLLHALAIWRFIRFAPGTHVLDLGCGGGLPGLPLAIVMPDVDFTLIDRTGKKVRVAEAIANELGLKNVTAIHGDAAELKEKYDFVVSRAVMTQPEIIKLASPLISNMQRNALPNGIITLKGGDLTAELRGLEKRSMVQSISDWFDEPFFKEKSVVYTEATPCAKQNAAPKRKK